MKIELESANSGVFLRAEDGYKEIFKTNDFDEKILFIKMVCALLEVSLGSTSDDQFLSIEQKNGASHPYSRQELKAREFELKEELRKIRETLKN